MSDLGGKTFVITGANTGIGKETALALARRGARVVLACRSLEKTQPVLDEIRRETGSDELGFVPIELGELASVRRAAAELLAKEARIDVLINNAGLAGQRGLTKDGFELHFGVNHLAHYLLTRLLLERIEASAPARVVTVSSRSHARTYGIDFEAVRRPTKTVSGLREYGVSKLANVLFSRELARRVPSDRVSTYALHPGVIASDIWRRAPWPVRPVMLAFMRSAEEGAKTSLFCATAPELAGRSGLYWDDCAERAPNRAARDDALALELWERSAEWVGLEP